MTTIRQFAEPDSDAVVALWVAAGVDRPWLDLRAEIAEKLERDPTLFLVATDDDRLVGAVMGAYDGRRGWAYHLAVEPGRQRTGIGRALMQALEVEMRALGIAKLNIQVRADNVQAVGFYERLGYVDQRLTSLGKWLR
jgi:ribosomal protein S18 acetylase RimI-like enzyme